MLHLLQRTEYSIPVAEYSIHVAEYSIPVAEYSIPDAEYSLPVAEYSIPVAEYRIPVAGRENSSVLYEGNWVQGERTGAGTLYHQDNKTTLYTGSHPFLTQDQPLQNCTQIATQLTK